MVFFGTSSTDVVRLGAMCQKDKMERANITGIILNQEESMELAYKVQKSELRENKALNIFAKVQDDWN